MTLNFLANPLKQVSKIREYEGQWLTKQREIHEREKRSNAGYNEPPLPPPKKTKSGEPGQKIDFFAIFRRTALLRTAITDNTSNISRIYDKLL